MQIVNKIFQKGFTLIELMIVIAIIGILSAVLYPYVSGYFSIARDTKKKIQIEQLATSLRAYEMDNGTFRVIGSGVNSSNGKKGEGWGWMLLKNYDYQKSIIQTLKDGGYYKGDLQEIKRIAWENQDIIEDSKNEPYCNTIIRYPYEFGFNTNIDDTQFQISVYLENATKKDKEYIKENEDFNGERRYINNQISRPGQGACSAYGRNYVRLY